MIDLDQAGIRPSNIRLLRTWDEQLCPICRKPLGYHIIITQQVDSDFPSRKLHVTAEVACGATDA